jgi:RNA polymerase sigma-70 factor (ECF subfamily)
VTDEKIYAEVRWDLMRYATSLVGADEAADVVSTVVTRALQRPGGLSGLRDAKPYLFRAISNEATTTSRRRARRLAANRVMAGSSGAQEVSSDAEVVDLLMSLPPRQRAALFLVGYEGYQPSEAATLLGCRPGTVRRYLFLARRKLREVLDG